MQPPRVRVVRRRARCVVWQALLRRDAILLVADVPNDLVEPQVALRIAVAQPPDGSGVPLSVTLPCTGVDRNGGSARLIFGFEMPGAVIVSAEILAMPGLEVVSDRRVADLLGCIFPVTDAEFRRVFVGRGLRWSDPRSNHVVARQLSLHFPGSAHYRCAAAPVLCYKAVELDDPQDAADALEIASALVPVAATCRRNWHPRKNGEHLVVSLLTAIWHVHIARGDIAALVDTLEQMRAGMDRISNYLSPSFNLCKSLLLYGYVLFRQGDRQRSKAMFQLVVEMFKRGVADIDVRRVTLLNELGASHQAAVLAAKSLHALNADDAPTLDDDAILAEALRVGGETKVLLAERLHAALAG